MNDVIEEGAIFHETIGECVRASEAVITMVGFPQDVEEVYLMKEILWIRQRKECI